MQPRRPTWIILIILGVIVTAVLGWWGTHRPKLDQQVYRIGFENQPPVHFLGDDGRPTGLAVDLLSEAARRRGIRLEWLLEQEGSDAALKAHKVDLWPMMTVRPERKGVVYITDPYREVEICMIVRSDSTYARLEDLRNATISYDGGPLDLRVLRPRLPDARLTVIESARASLEAVCQHRIDAAYLGEYTAITTLLAGIPCGGSGLRVIQLPELRGLVGVGSTLQARRVANALRDEIGAMAADGTFARISANWRSFSGRNLETADALVRTQRRERWLIAGISAAVLLLFLTLWQAAGVRRAHRALQKKNQELAVAVASAREATELKSQFLSNMSHEIRTPMNAILGMTSVALETPDCEERQEYLSDVMKSGESLLSLLNDILDLSKIEAGKLTFDRIDIDPANVARGVCSEMEQGAREKGLGVICHVPEPLPYPVRGDPQRLRQALMNLVGNAIKFTEHGRVELTMEVEAQSEHFITLRFAVTDSGIGITEEAQRRIFESFAQADASVARKYGGTGLGLAIAKQLVAGMGGELKVKSAPGRGSAFSFVLPFEKAEMTGEGATSGRSDSSLLDA
jgi:signal transduction histidine kinase